MCIRDSYVMLELGQPMHAFDLGRLRGGIEVRRARPGDRLEPVSYTHLDVYKRQGRSCSN